MMLALADVHAGVMGTGVSATASSDEGVTMAMASGVTVGVRPQPVTGVLVACSLIVLGLPVRGWSGVQLTDTSFSTWVPSSRAGGAQKKPSSAAPNVVVSAERAVRLN